MTNHSASQPDQRHSVFSVFITFLKLGLSAFGGPVAHIGYFHKEFVKKQQWLSDSQFSQLLAICQFLPGPASSQLGFSIGLLRAGWLGALAAFIAFTLPSVLLLIGFALLLPAVTGDFANAAIHGLKLVACVVVIDALLGMSQKLCPDTPRKLMAIFSAAILIVSGNVWLQIGLVLAGAVLGARYCQQALTTGSEKIQINYSKKLASIFIIIFAGIFIALPLFADNNSLLAIADAFYRAGALVFGGGHVVLPLLEESVVGNQWLDQSQFLAGYGASQAIPGPMFAFSAYLGALIPGEHSNLFAAFIAVIFMFLPGFLLVSAILPFWKSFTTLKYAASAVAGVNAVVVGLLAAALYDPIFISGVQSPIDMATVLIGLVILSVLKRSALWVVVSCVLLSIGSSIL
ncbi:chromate efflux transporter [Pelagibaculum spongiae]|uniref:Chromate ion family chromate transporter n=1 Tax=Pelagibaculum spongiae TaxID=2080658 RepID=A0A2V1H2U3_9GAMM|nr:chromate efflux transporter [Pelagibaculum spongiae]PVZ71538.1 chromate ion family chromate transporter [Pelagibaculum spongiae]